VQYVAYDGNGNVSALVNAANGATVANYEYGPFGEVIRVTGPMAKLNPAREGTKFYDDETDMAYYGHRYYNPSTGRWLSRDPIYEESFVNFNFEGRLPKRFRNRSDGEQTYVFVRNDAVNKIDWDGLLVLLEAHGVTGTPFNHSKITLMVDCPSKFFNDPRFQNIAGSGGLHYATVGAGPGSVPYTAFLVSGVNRPRDVQRWRNVYSAVVPDPAGMTDDAFIQLILDTNAKYDDEAWYDFFPQDDEDGYNSNGYASGVLLITTGSIPPAPPRTPGYHHPVPKRYFP
jgi:RHS repeat-associated protein